MLRYWKPWRAFLISNADRVKRWNWLYYKILDYLYPPSSIIRFK